MLLQFATRQGEDVSYRMIEVKLRHLGSGLPGHGADGPDDVCRTMACPDGPFRRLLRFIEIGRIFCKPPQACIRICHDGHEGLVHFVGDRCREFAHRRQPCDAREIRLRVAQRLLSPNALDVLGTQASLLLSSA
jgi:hypothetical protein